MTIEKGTVAEEKAGKGDKEEKVVEIGGRRKWVEEEEDVIPSTLFPLTTPAQSTHASRFSAVSERQSPQRSFVRFDAHSDT